MAQRSRSSAWNSRLAGLASAAIVILALHAGRELVVPIVVAGLLGFVLMPSVYKLERVGVRRVLAVTIVSAIAFLALTAVLWVVVVELGTIVAMIPSYERNIRLKLSSLGFDSLISAFAEFDLSPGPTSPDDTTAPAKPQETPVPVRMVGGNLPSLELLSAMAGRMLAPLAFVGLAGVVLVFLLLSWEDVRERAIRLVSFGRLTLTTRAMDEVARTISEVLRLQLVINAGFGLAAGVSLWLLGVPGAPLWGTLAVMLRFIPYIGMFLAAGMPVALAVAVSDGWSLPLIIAAIFILLDAIAGNFAEPALVGSRTGVSTLALLVAAAFWTWLWGLPGLLLSTPITVGLAVLGRHVPQLKVLDILLGDTPVLTPPERFYQRLIALDADDAGRLAFAHQNEHRLMGVYEGLFLHALRQLERDRQDGIIEDERAMAALDVLHELIEDAAEREPVPDDTPTWPAGSGAVVCLPARDEADALAASMLAAAIAAAGGTARALTVADLGADIGAMVRESGAVVVCISAVPPYAARHARLRRKQMAVRVPGVTVLTGLWAGDKTIEATETAGPLAPLQSGSHRGGGEPVITTLGRMVERVREMQAAAGRG